MKIRKIKSEEIDHIEALWNELKRHHQERTVDYSRHYNETTFIKRREELLAKDPMAIFVAEVDENVFGFCVVSIDGRQGEVDSLYVHASQRSYGAGKSLMNAGTEWLNTHDLDSIRLSVGQGNEEVLAFYEKLGFKTRATIMELI